MKLTWQKILSESYLTPQALLYDLQLSDAFDVSADSLFKTRVPKPFAEKMIKGDIHDPLLLQVLPQAAEFEKVVGFVTDPLAEQQSNPIAGVLHKYPSRVLLTLRGSCAVNCRYCFRRHFDYADNRVDLSRFNEITNYINSQPLVNEVILSGGDPLMAKDQQLLEVVRQLEALPQLKRLRIHTRLPVVIPERMTDELVKLLSQTRLTVFFVLHINHPNEIDDKLIEYLLPLKQKGIQLLNQSVLLQNINDNADTLVLLSEKLSDAGVLPYYLFLPDRVAGTAHFDVEMTKAKHLVEQMAERLPGYLVPKLAREEPGQGSKNWLNL